MVFLLLDFWVFSLGYSPERAFFWLLSQLYPTFHCHFYLGLFHMVIGLWVVPDIIINFVFGRYKDFHISFDLCKYLCSYPSTDVPSAPFFSPCVAGKLQVFCIIVWSPSFWGLIVLLLRWDRLEGSIVPFLSPRAMMVFHHCSEPPDLISFIVQITLLFYWGDSGKESGRSSQWLLTCT